MLDEHRRVVRDAVAVHAGIEVERRATRSIVFTRVSDAVGAASDIRTRSRSGVFGCGWGCTPVADGDGGGLRGAGRASRGAGDERGERRAGAVSESAHALLDGRWPVVDLGRHRLKDMGESERLYQLGSASFAPLRTLDVTNLPVVPNRLVGRTRELEELVGLFRAGEQARDIDGAWGLRQDAACSGGGCRVGWEFRRRGVLGCARGLGRFRARALRDRAGDRGSG